jgi:hypothetical protein
MTAGEVARDVPLERRGMVQRGDARRVVKAAAGFRVVFASFARTCHD